jgi:hypothetical protein
LLKYTVLHDFNDWTGLKYYMWESKGTQLGLGAPQVLGTPDEEGVQARQALSTTARADFGTATSPVAHLTQQYHQVTSAPYDPIAGFGWGSGTATPFDSGRGDDLSRDGVGTSNAEFDMDMAWGPYNVSVIMGNEDQAQNNVQVYLQGQLVDTVTTAAGQFHTAHYTVNFGNDHNLLQLRIVAPSGSGFLNALSVTPVGSFPSGEVRGVIWKDTNGNGVYDSGEVPVAGSTVYLTDTGGGQLGGNTLTAVTDSSGQFFFDSLAAGTYQVLTQTPTGWQSTTASVATVTLTEGQPIIVNFGKRPIPPVAVNDTATTANNTAVTIAVLANDSDPNGLPLSVVAVTQAPHGHAVINPNNTVTYTPATGFVGTDSFVYTISDGAASASATVTVTVRSGQPQQFDGVAVTPAAGVQNLTPQALQPIVTEAAHRLAVATGNPDTEQLLDQTDIRIAAMSGNFLGFTAGSTIWLDSNADGHGWFIDPTPGDAEFSVTVTGAANELQATPDSAAAGKVDLLAVVMHEMGHVLGWNDIDPAQSAHDLMTRTIGLGTRRLPSGWEGTIAVAAAGAPTVLASPATAVVQTAAGLPGLGSNLDVQSPPRLADVAPLAVSGPPLPSVSALDAVFALTLTAVRPVALGGLGGTGTGWSAGPAPVIAEDRSLTAAELAWANGLTLSRTVPLEDPAATPVLPTPSPLEVLSAGTTRGDTDVLPGTGTGTGPTDALPPPIL